MWAGDGEWVVLLPEDPDASARRIRDTIAASLGVRVGVIINDSFGKDDRDGSIGVAIGIAGIRGLEERTQVDLYGRPRRALIALVDELAATGSMLMGQADEAVPAVVVRGVRFTVDDRASISDVLILDR